MNNEKNYFPVFLGGLIAGSILGGIAALLFAPKSGKKMRKLISKKADILISEAQQKMEDAAEIAANIISDAKTNAEGLINDGKKKVEEIAKASEKIYKNSKNIVEENVSKMKDIF